MTDDAISGAANRHPRYPNIDIHLCKGCGDTFGPGDEVVSLSDGFIDQNEKYDVHNRRFWHRRCFPEGEFKSHV